MVSNATARREGTKRHRWLALLIPLFLCANGCPGTAARDAGCLLDTPGGDNGCRATEFCQFPLGSCGDNNGGGLCFALPSGCIGPPAVDPRVTCGCNGRSYLGGCQAAREGVSVRRFADEPGGQCP